VKKFLAALMLAVFLTVGCGSASIKSDEPVLPRHVQYIEDRSNETMKNKGLDAHIKIIRYEDDGHTLWLWTDHSNGPDDCDYVLVLGIVDRETNDYKVLAIYINQQIPNACEYADSQYKKYREVMGQMEEEAKPESNRRNDTI